MSNNFIGQVLMSPVQRLMCVPGFSEWWDSLASSTKVDLQEMIAASFNEAMAHEGVPAQTRKKAISLFDVMP